MSNRPYILSSESLTNSSKLLAKELDLDLDISPRNYPPTIRWANWSGDYGRQDTEYNSARLIYICSNKGRFSDYAIDNEIPHIEIREGIPERYPVVVRTTLSGSGGQGIVVCKSLEEFKPYAYHHWTYWRKFDSEFGIHMLGGSICKVFRKIPIEGREEEEFPIRNSENGYRFYRINFADKPRMLRFMEGVYSEFPLKFGRWDVGYIKGFGYEVIEVNSGPALSSNRDTLELYTEYLRKAVK